MKTSSTSGTPLHQPAHHESGYLHARGEAAYVDDLPSPPGTLYAQAAPSPVARGRIRKLEVTAARRGTRERPSCDR